MILSEQNTEITRSYLIIDNVFLEVSRVGFKKLLLYRNSARRELIVPEHDK